MTPALDPPEALRPEHALDSFDCGDQELNQWLRDRATANEQVRASRTYVVCLAGTREVVAFHALAAGSVNRADAPGKIRRNMPDPVPVMVLARLAVDRRLQGHGVGQGLLRDAVLRTLRAAEIAGIRALMVHALSDSAQAFYRHHRFTVSPSQPNLLLLRLDDAVLALSESE